MLLLPLYGGKDKISVSAFHIHSHPERNVSAYRPGWGAAKQVFNKGGSRTADYSLAHFSRGG